MDSDSLQSLFCHVLYWTSLLKHDILMDMKHVFKPLSFLPAILIMYLIFTFSGQTGDTSAELSYKVSCKVVEIQGQLTGQNYDDYTIAVKADSIHHLVRKAAHMTEYCLLAIAVSFPFYVYGLRGLPLVILAMGICVGFAGLDEYRQSFVAGRGPSKKDVLIDSCGALIGVTLVRIFCWIFLGLLPGRRKKKNR